MFDGEYCAPIYSNTAITCSSNEILMGGKCVCRDGWHNIQGKCYQCPQNTVWNGAFCNSNLETNNWCLGRPNTEYNNGCCNCMNGFVLVDGVCVRNL